MPSDIKKLAQSIPKAPADASVMKRLLEAVERLSGMVQLLMLEKQLTDLTSKVESLTGAKLDNATPKTSQVPELSKLLDNLEEFTTVRKTAKGDKREFLLHRLSADFEYENAADGMHYTTKDVTNWTGEIGVADLKQDRSEATMKGANPVVSCWIQEDAIKDIPAGQSNTGKWGNMGQNPNKNHYVIIVKPGTYEIYQELKQ